MRALGNELAQAVMESFNGDAISVRGPLGVRRIELTLETDPVQEALIIYANDHGSPQLHTWAQRARDHRAGAGDTLASRVPFGVVVITFGEALILVAMAGEMTVVHGVRLKESFGDQFAAVLPLGYADAMVGYVPTRRQRAEGGYEVIDSNLLYGRTGPFVRETEEMIHVAIASLVRDV